MGSFLSGLANRIKSNPMDIVYTLIIILLANGLFFLIRFFFLLFQRWYNRSRIGRNGSDFETEMKYLEKGNKPLNACQKFLLGQAGEVFVLSDLLRMLGGILFCVILVFCLAWLAEAFPQTAVPILWITRVIVVLVGIAIIFLFGKAIYELVKHGRVLLFLFGIAWMIVIGILINITFVLYPI